MCSGFWLRVGCSACRLAPHHACNGSDHASDQHPHRPTHRSTYGGTCRQTCHGTTADKGRL